MAKVAGRASRQTAGSGFRLLARILLAVTGAGCWLASAYLDVGGAQYMPSEGHLLGTQWSWCWVVTF